MDSFGRGWRILINGASRGQAGAVDGNKGIFHHGPSEFSSWQGKGSHSTIIIADSGFELEGSPFVDAACRTYAGKD